MTVLGVIPARLASSRLPRKVLREIAGKPMVVHVYERAQAARRLTDLLVATDSDEVIDVCRSHHVPAVMTSPDHPSGTDRVWEVAQGRVADIYVGIQGDEPLLTPGHIDLLVTPFIRRPETQVTTLKIRATPEEVASPHSPKVVCDALGQALYFSRHPIPFDRDGRGVVHYKHIGLYAYHRHALDAFHRMPPSTLELTEGLEQLRFLEHGIPIVVSETTEAQIGVDTEEDLRAVEALLARRSS
ncbi:MAG: 3-deoxy-manno-octulosonate cytidylyltransferase [Candidatus Rokubacteria bacterium]|nr:3-deoxy-manno-octulosonate cytidylyltransferase [Candidatus Rokubacteria bacterium]MBI3824540.1 3-deoxy-manno-octulosonate cytidylyltransferase [Candidatus Rokubacteria bacterium]